MIPTPFVLPGREPPPNWPEDGRIQFERVSVRYSTDSDPVLRAVSVDLKAGEKVRMSRNQ